MSRSRRGQRNLGDEYWSRRPLNGYGPSSENKHITHGIERAEYTNVIIGDVKDKAPSLRILHINLMLHGY